VVRPKNQVRGLVEKWLESLENGIPHELEDALQHGVNSVRFEAFSRRIVERYKNGGLSLHFHVFEARRHRIIEAQPDATESCAIAQFIIPQKHGANRVLLVQPFEDNGASHDCSQMEIFVFVDVMEIVERFKRILPTVVRLQPLDQCHRLFGNTLKPFALQGSGEIIGTATDRKGSAIPRFVRGIGQNEAVNDVIQGRADIEQEIADDRSERIRRFRQTYPQKHCIALRVFLGNDLAIAVSERAKDFDYRIQMLLCPDEFESGTPQSGLGDGTHIADSSTFG